MAKMFSMEDWEKMTIEKVKMRWENRRREIKEIERKKKEIEDKIELRKMKKEKRRRRVIRERRCFVCGVFGHMAHYCRNREEKKGLTQMPLNKFEILKDRVMEKGEESGREVVKDRKEISKEEREKKMKKEKKGRKTKVQKKDLGGKKEKKETGKKDKRGRGKKRRDKGRGARFLQRRNLEKKISFSMVEGVVLRV